ncbi:MAG: lysyl oxidase family protein [Myxococcota bacterium]
MWLWWLIQWLAASVQSCPDPGALVDVRMSSTAGVLLDEIPADHREAVAAEVLARGPQFWEDRARQQVSAMKYRLVYRNFFYANKLQLPLPPPELWEVVPGAPYRTTVDGHDLVVVDYTFHAVLLTGEEQPELAEKKLRKTGKVWTEPFLLPIDPDLLFDRTGYACMDEDAFPPDSVDSETALEFFDHECTAGDPVCHVTYGSADEDCDAALYAHVGAVEAGLEFERLPWSATLADQVRVGAQVPGIAAGKALTEGLDENRVEYVYFPEDDCAVEEACIGAPGWRRLLKFTSTVQNVGSEDLFLGDVESPDSPIIEHNVVVYDQCHDHYHFNFYGDFEYDGGVGGKRAFCLEAPSGTSATRTRPSPHPYGCFYQGIAAGWGDDYVAGIACQWVDITDIQTKRVDPVDLVFDFNPEQMLCEGAPCSTRTATSSSSPRACSTSTASGRPDRVRHGPRRQRRQQRVAAGARGRGGLLREPALRRAPSSARCATATTPRSTTTGRAPPARPPRSAAPSTIRRRPPWCASARPAGRSTPARPACRPRRSPTWP